MSGAQDGEVRRFLLPDLGEGLTAAEIVEWLVAVGDAVAVDQPVAEVETAKAAVQVPCPFGGTVAELHGAPGETVAVGSPLVSVHTHVGDPPEAPAEPQAPAAPDGPVRSGPDAEATGGSVPGAPDGGGATGSGAVLVGYGTRPEGPSRRRPPRRDATGEAPRTTASAEPPPRPGGPRGQRAPVISPLVRRVAREHGIDAASLTGSGEGGLVLRRDVEAAVAAAPSAAADPLVPRARTGANGGGALRPQSAEPVPAAAPAPAPDRSPAGAERVALSAPHREMARRMARSRREIPEATVWVDADATGLLELRTALNEADPERPVSLLALLARFCVVGLDRFPALNSRFDPESEELLRPPGVELGFAAQTARGLVVPVVGAAHALTTRQLSAELGALTEQARAGTLPPARLSSGTFTVNNYGVFGVDGAAAVINHPESAIAGMGRIVDRPWVVGEELAVRPVTELTLAFDHRVCDGAEAGAFLRFIADCVERPARLIGDM
ncbi:dihydrolipoamide acetyltransferase family protein [Streptomonospora litoralis]|uniref:Dihydrolipoamide acetyltransferase component of pyruvate dehydrogenase complex n=1 Tax=Streptomonospora litoralis TaxID=2498135 RepID=A0A4P6Q8A8_9ACTN|nr:dihydrolipoamide acetyltransferase family protein [Streptomonospora litoralis]QBI55157.1 Dihydrolipoyllysine-residue acyltransferase component of branched-chain alpha-ketoacid dehydrogenase complex [Streptomonospora litoralis]